ncbi:uncharacterized protein PRCAT00001234001 [Priceomyces carsonii]|uniref:uncharacterized protein n=1 Tax=Priceomyces carsonii TaxID=28549 RepID=UPI002ED7EA95|nr:unnamed protein product [Priceomyces carsonii]
MKNLIHQQKVIFESSESMVRYALTIISRTNALDETAISQVERLLDEGYPEYEKKKLSQRAIDYIMDPKNPEQFNSETKSKLNPNELGCDLFFQVQSIRRTKKLFVFDMDSTLIYQEVIELIAAYANIENQVAVITEKAMNGEIDFNESLIERVALLKGIDSSSIWDELKVKIRITKGARELCRALKRLNVITAVCSGGFIPLADHIKKELGLDYAFANQLGVDSNNILDGTTVGPIVNGDKKAELLQKIAKDHSIDLSDSVAVGDGANDLKMMLIAGYGIAWNAKPKVQQLAPSCLNSNTLRDILYVMGFSDAEIIELCK